MSSLTVTEKNHWKERINRKIDQAIDRLLASKAPDYLERISRTAKERALESLGLKEWYRRLEELQDQEVAVARERQKVFKTMVTLVTRTPENEQPGSYYVEPASVQDACRKRQAHLEEQLLADDELGKQVLALRREKEELLDTVWLATSGKQIRLLWGRVAEVLNQQPTQLQQEALAVEPVESE